MMIYGTEIFNLWIWIQTLLSYLFGKCTRTMRHLGLIGKEGDDPTSPAGVHNILEAKFGRPPPPIDAIEKSSEKLPGGGLVGLIYKIIIQYSLQDDDPQQQEKVNPKPDESSPSPPDVQFPRSLVVKREKEGFHSRLQSRYFQNAREAIFYAKFAPRHESVFASIVPEVYHSRGSLLTGEFVIVMEDLTEKAVPSTHMLGNQCWGPPPTPLPEAVKHISEVEIVRTIFTEMAKVHARFWMDESLLTEEWMTGVKWRNGDGRWGWEAAFEHMRARWVDLSTRELGGKIFTNLQREVVERLLRGTQWRVWQRENGVMSLGAEKRTASCFTLTHGDFHAGNILWRIDQSKDQAIMVDWSEVGMGCPFTDLAQFMISNATVEFRRENERQLFDEYYQQLVERGVDPKQYPPEMGWERYKAGGIERWLQLLILLAAAEFAVPEFALLWFSRQVDSFLQDHYSSVPKCFNSVYCLPLE
ncbi:unnamed protein product [Calypogeia fissa]